MMMSRVFSLDTTRFNSILQRVVCVCAGGGRRWRTWRCGGDSRAQTTTMAMEWIFPLKFDGNEFQVSLLVLFSIRNWILWFLFFCLPFLFSSRAALVVCYDLNFYCSLALFCVVDVVFFSSAVSLVGFGGEDEIAQFRQLLLLRLFFLCFFCGWFFVVQQKRNGWKVKVEMNFSSPFALLRRGESPMFDKRAHFLSEIKQWKWKFIIFLLSAIRNRRFFLVYIFIFLWNPRVHDWRLNVKIKDLIVHAAAREERWRWKCNISCSSARRSFALSWVQGWGGGGREQFNTFNRATSSSLESKTLKKHKKESFFIFKLSRAHCTHQTMARQREDGKITL